MMIDGWKNRGLDARRRCRPAKPRAFANGKGRELYTAYQERLKTLNACDFGDLLLENIRLFREQPGRAAASISARFRYILVDEYQDTNVAQYLWLRLLAQRPRRRIHLSPRRGHSGRRGRARRSQRPAG